MFTDYTSLLHIEEQLYNFLGIYDSYCYYLKINRAGTIFRLDANDYILNESLCIVWRRLEVKH